MSQSTQITDKVINETILAQTKLLSEASEIISQILSNLFGFLDELSRFSDAVAKKNQQTANDINETANLTRNLIDYTDQVHLEIPALFESMKESDNQLKEYQNKLELMKIEQEKVNLLLNKSEELKKKIEMEANENSTYTSAMGSILGTMLWKTSKTEEVIETLINTGEVHEFLIMSSVTMSSFMESYVDRLPSQESCEFKFIMSIIGTNINISAQRIGRNYVLDHKIGLNFIQNILDYIAKIKMPEGRLLKRMCLILLYNISICKRGAMLIQMSERGVENILKCIQAENTNEIQTLTLTLMTSLLSEIASSEFSQKVKKLTSREDLQLLMGHDDANLKHMCTKFHNKIMELEAFDENFDS